MSRTIDRHDDEPDARDGSRPRVVVGVDGTPGSVAALRAGEWAAAARGGTLVAVTATSDGAEAADALLATALAEAFAGRSLVPIRFVASPGSAVDALVAASREADLLVVGSRGRGGLGGLLLGSVSMACAARASCPVLMMHPADRSPASGRPQPGTRVVVGVGGTADPGNVLRFAATAAEEMDAELLAVAAWDDTALAGDVRDELADAAERAITEEVAAVFGTRRPARLRVEVHEGPPAGILIDRSRSADLVVVGRAIRSELADVLLGGVGLSVAEHADAPVLVVPTGARPAARPVRAGLLVSARP